jgi:tRNA pseudouridine38-40 synthase
MRYALGLEYDGTEFSGWQFQTHSRSVQECVEIALSKVADHSVKTYCAGRTDAGVHAAGQVIHFDSSADRKLRAWVFGTNVHLPRGIAVHWAEPVPDVFHARFSARRRSYRYYILNRPARPGLLASRVTWECRVLDAARMHTAAQYLLGEHDFSAFRAQGCQARHPVRTIYRIGVEQRGALLVLEVEANAFLHHMVRNIAGVLLAIGRGEAAPEWARAVLIGRQRAHAGITAPAAGLYLTHVHYEDFMLPAPADVFLGS